MNDSSISVRYAKALFSLAQEKGVLEAVNADMENLLYLSNLLPEYKQILDSPVIKPSDKQKFLTALLGSQMNELTASFFSLLLTNSREAYLPMMARNFLMRYKQNSGITSAVLTSVVPLDKKVVEQFRTLIAEKYDSNIDLSCVLEPSLLGGFLLQVEDQQIDASVSTRLKMLRQEFVKSK